MSVKVRRLDDGSRRYDVRLRDPSGRVYNRTFRTRRDADTYTPSSPTGWPDPRVAA